MGSLKRCTVEVEKNEAKLKTCDLEEHVCLLEDLGKI
jgi:hypothetical protein